MDAWKLKIFDGNEFTVLVPDFFFFYAFSHFILTGVYLFIYLFF